MVVVVVKQTKMIQMKTMVMMKLNRVMVKLMMNTMMMYLLYSTILLLN